MQRCFRTRSAIRADQLQGGGVENQIRSGHVTSHARVDENPRTRLIDTVIANGVVVAAARSTDVCQIDSALKAGADPVRLHQIVVTANVNAIDAAPQHYILRHRSVIGIDSWKQKHLF